MKLYHYWKHRMSHPLRGFTYALKNDSAIQIELICGSVTLLLLNIFLGPFSSLGTLLLVFCFFLIIITELQNSALETALDRLHPELHDEIGRSKDLASASVLVAAIFGLVCLYFVLTGKI